MYITAFGRTIPRSTGLGRAPRACRPGAPPRSTGARSGDATTRLRCATPPPPPPRPGDRAPRSSAGRSVLEVDQCVAAFRESGPRLDLDHVVEERSPEPGADFLRGGAQGAAALGPGGGRGVAGEELELLRAGREPGELDGESLD